MKQKDVYIAALEYGESLLNKGEKITFSKLQKHLEDEGYSFNPESKEQLLRDLAREAFYIYVSGDENTWKNYPSNLNIEGYSKLLNYKELKEARDSSRKAKWYAIIAIAISIVTLFTSIYFSIQSLNRDTTINNKQFKIIENIWNSLKK